MTDPLEVQVSRVIRWSIAIVIYLAVAYTLAWLTWEHGLPLIHTKTPSDRLALVVGVVLLVGAGVILPLASWATKPLHAEADREALNELFAYLETRRALWIPFNSEDHEEVVGSVLDMRKELSGMQRKLRPKSSIYEPIRRMRFTCERFLTDTPQAELYFYSNLGELRGIFGAELGLLAREFRIEVREPLSWVIPPTDRSKVGKFVPIGFIWREVNVSPPEGSKPPPLPDSLPDGSTSDEAPDESEA